MTPRFKNKVVLIAGTGGGMGREAALRFAAEGARVVGCDVKVDGKEALLVRRWQSTVFHGGEERPAGGALLTLER